MQDMQDFNERFAEAFTEAGLSIVDETGNEMSPGDMIAHMNNHTVYEIDGVWYTYDSIFYGGVMCEQVVFYMLNDCNVSGLCIIRYDNKFGVFPLIERTGQQSGIWACDGYPFVYDEVKVYADWNKWNNYGYVAIRKGDNWGILKITQCPEPKREVIVDCECASLENAVIAAGITELPEKEPYKRTL